MKAKALKCQDVLKVICDELDSKLGSAKCREIKKHLARCPDCTTYLDSLKKTIRLYSSYPAPRVPSANRRKLLAVLKIRD